MNTDDMKGAADRAEARSTSARLRAEELILASPGRIGQRGEGKARRGL